MPVKVDDPRDIQSAYDTLGDPNQLHDAETRGSDSSYAQSGIDQLQAYANDPANKVKEAEADTTANNAWAVNRSEDSLRRPSISRNEKMKSALKKGGPTAGIVGGLIAAVFGIGSLASMPATLLNHLTAGFLEKWDTRSITSTVRTNKILVKKMTGDTTSGSCSTVKIMCRYSKPSSKLLKNLEQQGVKAFTEAGDTITPNKVFPNTRPSYYELTRSDGTKLKVTAKEFSKTLSSDVEFSKAFHVAYNTRFQNFADSVFDKVLKAFGGSKADKLGSVSDEADAKNKINTDVAGEDTGAKAAASEGDNAVENVFRKIFSKEMVAILQKLAKASARGSAIQLALGAVCIASDAPGIAAKIVRSYQMAQLIKFALIFLTTSDKIKAGDATPSEVSALGTMLTTTTKDSSGAVTNRAATDSFGVKYGLFGDTDTSTQTEGHDYAKFAPGGNIVAALSNVTQYTDATAKKQACEIAMNPLTGTAINAALLLNSGETVGITAIVAGINYVGGVAAGWALEQAAPYITDFLVNTFGGLFKDMLSYFLGDLTQDLVGEDVGNALASGTAQLLSQSANAGGNVPLSIDSALAYQKVSDEVNLAYAEEDRLGRSPFDISSPNTFLGSIATKLIPYMSSMSSATGIFSTLSSLSLGAFSTMLSPSTSAADSAAQYTMCSDTSLNNGVTAVGPFCNVVYGIPTEYLDRDPGDVLQTLIDQGQVDENTGEPVPDKELDVWMSTCLDGKTDQVTNCQLDTDDPTISAADKSRIANYALYTVDHQIQKTMDGEDVVETTDNSSSTTVQSTVTSDEWKTYTNGNIPLSSLAPISSVGLTGCSSSISVPYLAPSALSDFKRMYDAFKADTGKKFELASCYRTYAQQVAAYRLYRSGNGNKAADPGTSNHGWAKAIDITMEKYGGYNSPQYKWLKAHATEYNWVTGRVSGEPWHIEYTGSLP